MSDLSNNIAILSYLKDKVHKWKNISILLGVVVILLLARLILGDSFSGKIETGNYIANIKIEGVIFEDDFRTDILEEIAKDDSAKAVIINIDSPGGGIVGSEVLYLNLQKISKKKPVIVVMHSVAASGGYMAAIAAEHIIAHNGTLTGSIGVLMQSAEMVDLANKLGVKFNTFKSAPLKASPSPFEKLDPYTEQVVQESIRDSAEFFFDLVKERRGEKLNKANLSRIFDGRIFTGRQALKAGLIDQIGGKQEALDYLKTKHNIDSESISLREVEIEKDSDRLVDKLIGFLPFGGFSKTMSGHEIMAIMPN